MDTVSIEAKKRTKTGSRPSRVSRREGLVPAILYGHGMEPVSMEVDRGALAQALHTKAGENVVIDLKLEGQELKESTCRIRDIQHHPVTDEIQHVDFTVISLLEKIEVDIPVHILHADEAVGVKDGGVLDIVHHELPVECLPTQIPENIEFSVKALKINDAIHLKDLTLPEGVTCLLEDEDEVIVAIHPPRVEEEEEATDEEATEPEVIEKGKKDEDEDDGDGGDKKAEPKGKKED